LIRAEAWLAAHACLSTGRNTPLPQSKRGQNRPFPAENGVCPAATRLPQLEMSRTALYGKRFIGDS
jgi:hypothetical protein